MTVWVDITFSIDHPAAPHPGAVHFRVLASKEEDWSGWASDMEEATRMAMSRRKDIQSRLGACDP